MAQNEINLGVWCMDLSENDMIDNYYRVCAGDSKHLPFRFPCQAQASFRIYIYIYCATNAIIFFNNYEKIKVYICIWEKF